MYLPSNVMYLLGFVYKPHLEVRSRILTAETKITSIFLVERLGE